MGFVTKSLVKDMAKQRGMRISGEAWEAIDKAVEEMIDKAFARAKANRRNTLKAADL